MPAPVLDFSADYLVWDAPEPVDLLSARTLGDVVAHVPTALRLPISSAEAAVSEGVYRADDVRWMVPGTLCAPGRPPKVADVVRDAAGTRYTVLSVVYGPLADMYDLTTRDLVLAYDLRDAVSIYRRAAFQDAAGSALPAYRLLHADVPAKVQLLSQGVTETLGKRGTTRQYAVYLADDYLLRASDQLRVTIRGEDLKLQVISVMDAAQIDALFTLTCEVLP